MDILLQILENINTRQLHLKTDPPKQPDLTTLISQQDLTQLYLLFGNSTLSNALYHIQLDKVSLLTCNDRSIFKIETESFPPAYYCLPPTFACNCNHSFAENQMKYCSHSLASMLSFAIGTLKTTNISNEEMALLIYNCLVVSPLDWLRVSLGSIPGQVGCLAWWSERGLGRSE
ncbi:hypothetical protein BB558_004728, partial [Smittium angustum]